MTNSKTTKRALLTSVMALVLCFAMLTGTTFAWFTDTETSANNKIVAGNLDIQLLMWDGDGTEDSDYTDIGKNGSPIFGAGSIAQNNNAETVWEPGKTQVAYLALKNNGNLAIKYQVSLDVENVAKNLYEVMEYAIVADKSSTNLITETSWDSFNGLPVNVGLQLVSDAAVELPVGTTHYFALAIHMQEEADNNYQKGEVNFDIIVNATQLNAEGDAFGKDYDEPANLPYTIVSTPDELAGVLASGGNAVLNNDINVTEPVVIEKGATSTLDLNGNNLSIGSDMVTLSTNTPDATNTYALNNLGTLTLKDSKGTGVISARGIYNGYDAEGNYVTDAKLIVENGTYNAMGTDGGAAIFNYGVVEINGGKFTSVGGYGLNNRAGATMTVNNADVTGGIYNMGTLTVNDGEVYQHISGRHGIYNWAGNVTINGGEFDSISGNELILADGQNASVVINDGKFDKTGKSWLFGATAGMDITFEINDGVFNGYVNLPENTVDGIRPNGDPIVVKGGSFNFDPTNNLAEGYNIAAVNGIWYVAEASTVIIGGEDENGEEITLDSALKSGETTILLPAGEFIIPDSAKGKTLTIKGTGDTTIASQDDGAAEGDCDYSFDGSTVTFENVTITTSTTYFPGYARMKGIYNNCTINGVWTLYDDSEFNNCTFNVSGDIYNVWTWGATTATFNGCTFNSDGKAILLYGTANTTLTVNNCVFNDNGGLPDLKAAIEIGNDYGKSYNLIVNNTTVNGYEINDKGINTGTTLWANKNSMGTDKLNVVIDGVDVY